MSRICWLKENGSNPSGCSGEEEGGREVGDGVLVMELVSNRSKINNNSALERKKMQFHAKISNTCLESQFAPRYGRNLEEP